MDTHTRAKRDALARAAILAAADQLGDRFGVDFDAGAATRKAPGPEVRLLFEHEALADWLTALAEVTAKPASAARSASSAGAATAVVEDDDKGSGGKAAGGGRRGG